ncbi:Cyclomaltodextrinase [Granulicella mallensis MP5ACTX8]|uniref:Cyclomaltodextrinase n=2 Tax=Granulicella mallensis TaxID=940614 RepID=G8NSH7_GRAMM|nr:Cyclomaltodextrinase [Granulicella mallensis MP5ACTX8]
MFWCKCERWTSLTVISAALLAGVCVTHPTQAQISSSALKIEKVDPPNWWAAMPKPMLLVRGEGFSGAKFSLSDASLHVEKTVVSANGHWAQVWLEASPVKPETITLRARRNGQTAETKYTFAARRPVSDGFAGFSSRDVMYLIMTDRFADGDLTNDGLEAHSAADSAEARAERDKPRGWHGGDLRGVTQHLDYLQQLGVTAVWTTPVYENHEKESYHGYGATDLYRVDDHYGSLDDLKVLASALHARGMKLVLDTVPNHVGPGNPWVHDEPAPDWFHGTAESHLKAETNFHALIDPHASDRDRVGTLHGWFANVLPDMNTESPAVAQYLRQDAVWWIEQTGADALRIDTFPYVDREFWHEFHGELAKLYPRLTEVGEVFNGDPVITSSFAGGVTRAGVDTGLFTPFDFPTYFALRDVFLKGESLKKLSDVLESDSLYPHPERLVPFLGNHDTARFSQGATTDAALRLAFAYLLTTRGMPQIYSGDELAMKGGEDPDNRRDFPGGFPEATKNAFTAAGRSPEQAAMFDWVSRLTAIRHKDTALTCGGLQMLNSGENWLVFLRDSSHAPASGCTAASDDQKVLVAIHRGQASEALTVDLTSTWAAGCRVGPTELGISSSVAEITGQQLKLQMGSNDVLIAACH